MKNGFILVCSMFDSINISYFWLLILAAALKKSPNIWHRPSTSSMGPVLTSFSMIGFLYKVEVLRIPNMRSVSDFFLLCCHSEAVAFSLRYMSDPASYISWMVLFLVWALDVLKSASESSLRVLSILKSDSTIESLCFLDFRFLVSNGSMFS